MQMFRKLFIAICMAVAGVVGASAVNVTLTVDEGVERKASLDKAEANLARVLTEINAAQKAHSDVSVKNLQMNDFAKKSLVRLWSVTPFYCDDEEVVERAWLFKDGTIAVYHIPLIITPEGEAFGMGTYQDAVVEFDANGVITDFRFALDSQTRESMERCGDVADKEHQMIILKYLEDFRTAYNKKDIQTIDQMFSDDALIITGHVTMKRQGGDTNNYGAKVEYTRQNKQQYLANLRKAFARNKWINVEFSQIGEHGENTTGCQGITRSVIDKTKYGVRLHQSWKSSNYSDEGYLFLLWEFPENGGSPIIHVRTWQPEWVGGKRSEPDSSISTLGGFDL